MLECDHAQYNRMMEVPVAMFEVSIHQLTSIVWDRSFSPHFKS